MEECQSCNKKLKSILGHIAKSEDCKKYYSDNSQELEKLREKSRKRKRVKVQESHALRSKVMRSIENKKYYQENKKQIIEKYHSRNNSISNFYKEIQYGPIFPCVCCKRRLFERGMKVFTERFQEILIESSLQSYIDLSMPKINGILFICDTCYGNLAKKNMPNLCFMNGLHLSPVPPCLQISSLGNQLLAKNLIFYKFRSLHKTGMTKMNDRVCNFASKTIT